MLLSDPKAQYHTRSKIGKLFPAYSLALDGPYGGEAGALWRKSRLRDRMQAIIAHEMAEHEHDDHELALIAAPDTTLAIGRGARELLRRMENGWKWR